ncbi:pentatricopeptide repeat domain-containing protein 1 [Paragonimus westermani]|uniref:Pentatricopeptide repeat domain-containing protein 1 n=1 Tax=Paragonimus westermani TaxID=34504 RepID=A0A5J4P4X5_9TREM|nr:pentatricopeptide repeat domain-containing protein 1 [Paragonimus westermani]
MRAFPRFLFPSFTRHCLPWENCGYRCVTRHLKTDIFKCSVPKSRAAYPKPVLPGQPAADTRISSSDSSNIPVQDRFGALAAEVDTTLPTLHQSIQNKRSAQKATDTLLQEPLENQSQDVGLRRDRSHPRYQRDSQMLVKYCKSGNVTSALEVFFDIMLTRDRVAPTRFDTHMLLQALSKIGQSESAFRVYKKMKEIGVQPTQATYSRLFNDLVKRALSSGELLEQFGGPGLKRAQLLWHQLRAKNTQLNLITYNTLILALAKGGDLQGCLTVLDVILATYSSKNSLVADSFTLCALLSAFKPFAAKQQLIRCLNPNETSTQPDLFERILTIWHRLAPYVGSSLSSHNFVLLIGAIKSLPPFGTKHANSAVLTIKTSDSAPLLIADNARELGEDRSTVQSNNTTASTVVTVSQYQPNWADISLSLTSPVNLLRPIRQEFSVSPPPNAWLPWQRLAMLGGLCGILDTIEHDYKSQLNAPLLTELVGLLPMPPSPAITLENEFDEWERVLIQTVRRPGIVPDMGFFNALINRRTSVGISAKCLLGEAIGMGLLPDQVTWGSLARGCRSVASIRKLLQAFSDSSKIPEGINVGPSSRTTATVRPSLTFFVSLLSANHFNWDVKAYVLRLMMGEEERGTAETSEHTVVCDGVAPDRRLIASLDVEVALFRELLANNVIPADGSQVAASSATGGFAIPAYAASSFRRFIPVYKRWLRTCFPRDTSPTETHSPETLRGS